MTIYIDPVELGYNKNMIETLISLEPETHQRLQELAAAQGKTPETLIQEVVQSFTHQAPPIKRPQRIGRHRSGQSTISSQAEELLKQATQNKQWQ